MEMDVKDLLGRGEDSHVRVFEFLPHISASIDYFRLDDINQWMSLFTNKMDDDQVPAIIRSVEKDGFQYPIGIGTVNDWTQLKANGDPNVTLSIGNGHHRLMLGILAEVIRKYKITNVMSVKAVIEFSKPLVYFGNTWPMGSTRNETGYHDREYFQKFDLEFYPKKVVPHLDTIKEYINDMVFTNKKSLVTV
jgi:hypothetical protein